MSGKKPCQGVPANDLVASEKAEPLVESFPSVTSWWPILVFPWNIPHMDLLWVGSATSVPVILRHGGQARLDFHNSSPELSYQHFLQLAICSLKKKKKRMKRIGKSVSLQNRSFKAAFPLGWICLSAREESSVVCWAWWPRQWDLYLAVTCNSHPSHEEERLSLFWRWKQAR